MKKVQVEIVAKKLLMINAEKFGGKNGGRYKISYERLKQIAEETILTEEIMMALNQNCLQIGIYLINLGHEFAVIETSILSGYRNVPQGVVEKIINISK